MRFNADGRWLAIASCDSTIQVCDITSFSSASLDVISHPDGTIQAYFLPESDDFVTVGVDRTVEHRSIYWRVKSVYLDPDIIADTGAGWVRINFMVGPWPDPQDTTRHQGHLWEETYRTIIDDLRSEGLDIYGLISTEIVAEDPGKRFRNPHPPGDVQNDWIDRYVDAYITVLALFKNDLSVVESLNEPDDWHAGDRNWFHASWFAIIQKHLYAAVRADPTLDHIKLVSGRCRVWASLRMRHPVI